MPHKLLIGYTIEVEDKFKKFLKLLFDGNGNNNKKACKQKQA